MHDLKDDYFKMNDTAAMLVKLSFTCNTSAKLVTNVEDEITHKMKKGPPSGNKTEIALLKFVANCGTDAENKIDPIAMKE